MVEAQAECACPVVQAGAIRPLAVDAPTEGAELEVEQGHCYPVLVRLYQAVLALECPAKPFCLLSLGDAAPPTLVSYERTAPCLAVLVEARQPRAADQPSAPLVANLDREGQERQGLVGPGALVRLVGDKYDLQAPQPRGPQAP